MNSNRMTALCCHNGQENVQYILNIQKLKF